MDPVRNGVAHLEVQSKRIPFPERGKQVFLRIDDWELSEIESGNGFWLFRAESGACGILPEKLRITRSNLAVRCIAVLHHGDKVTIEEIPARFWELFTTHLHPDDRLVGKNCQYCGCAHEAGEQVFACPYCSAAYHEDCWKELESKKCCSRNCRFSPGKIEVG